MPANGPRTSRLPGAVFLVALCVYLFFPSRNWNYADDALRWAYGLTQTEGLINVHHLGLEGLRWIYARIPAGTVDPAAFLAAYAAFAGALGLAFLCALLLHLEVRPGEALAGTLLCATTAGYWCYAIVGDVYVPAAAFLILGTYAMVRGLQEARGDAPWVALAAAAFLLALLQHQAHFVFVAALPVGVLIARGLSARKRVAYGIVVPALTGLLSILAWGAAYRTSTQAEPNGGFRSFAAGYAESFVAYPDMKQLSLGTLVNAGAGAARAIVSYDFLFHAPRVTQAVQKRYPYRHVHPYPFLVREMSRPGMVLVGICSAGALLLSALLAASGLLRIFTERRPLAVVMTAAAAQALFFSWWEGVSDEFWIWSLPFLALAATVGAPRFGKWSGRLLGLAAALLLVSTFAGTIRYVRDEGNDIDQVNKSYVSAVGPQDMVIALDEIIQVNRMLLLRQSRGFTYFNLFGRAEKGKPNDLERLTAEVTATVARGGLVYVDPYLLDPPSSYTALIQLRNAGFEAERARVLEIVKTIASDRVRFPAKVASTL